MPVLTSPTQKLPLRCPVTHHRGRQQVHGRPVAQEARRAGNVTPGMRENQLNTHVHIPREDK